MDRILLNFAVALPFTLFFMCIAEYAAHRWVMHWEWKHKWLRWLNRFSFDHHDGEHHRKNMDHPVWLHIDLLVRYHLFATTPLWLIQFYRISHGELWIFGRFVALMVVLFGHSYVWSKLHRQMHGIENNWTGKLWCYEKLYAHHMLHHEQSNRNYSVLSMWTDRLFRTAISTSKRLNSYEYVGSDVRLKGTTYLGSWFHYEFKVQANKLNHPYAFNWTTVARKDFKCVTS